MSWGGRALLDTRAEPSEVEDLVGAQDLTGCLSAGSSPRFVAARPRRIANGLWPMRA